MNTRLQNALMVIAVLCALTTTGLVVRRELAPRGSRPPNGKKLGETAHLIATAPHSIGPRAAEATLIEFFDLQCPACREFSRVLDSVRIVAPFSVRVVRHHFPLVESHLKAQDLALAGLCLRDDPTLFEEYYHRAFEFQRILNDSRSVDAVAVLPPTADSAAVRACMRTTATLDALNAELRLADSLQLTVTPSFIIGDRLYGGGRSVAEILRLLEESRR